MINFKRCLAATLCCVFCTFAATACGDDKKDEGSLTTASDAADDKSSVDEKEDASGTENGSEASTGKYINYTAPEIGEEILVITVKDKGDIKIKLFPEEAEKGVENITTHAKNGYYNGHIFHRVIKDFVIQGGDPLGEGYGGESIWGGQFEGGTSDKLTHIAGAVAYANSGSTATNGSQFYIVTGEKVTDDTLNLYASNGITIPDEVLDLYKQEGGVYFLDGKYTIFGQVFDGLDIIFDLQNVETDENDKPVEQIVIEKMTVEKYNGEDVKFRLSDYK